MGQPLDDRIRDLEENLAQAEEALDWAAERKNGADPHATIASREQERKHWDQCQKRVWALQNELSQLKEQRRPFDGQIQDAQVELKEAREALRWSTKKKNGADPNATAASRQWEREQWDRDQKRVWQLENSITELRDQQRAAKLGPRVSGTVKFFNDDKGFGFVTCDGGKDVFVHQSAVETPPLRKGDKVDLNVGPGPKGPQGQKVRKR